MSNNLTTYEPAHDGFSGFVNSGGVGNRLLRWNDSQHWMDRDGVAPPSPVLVNLATGEVYTYSAATTGAHIAVNHLREAVITMRALRGTRCLPLVNLGERPMKTNFGLKQRPSFEIIAWKTPADAKALTPQVATPVAAPTGTPTLPETPLSKPAQQRQPKPTINLAADTIAAMGDVKPVSLDEELDDEIPF